MSWTLPSRLTCTFAGRQPCGSSAKLEHWWVCSCCVAQAQGPASLSLLCIPSPLTSSILQTTLSFSFFLSLPIFTLFLLPTPYKMPSLVFPSSNMFPLRELKPRRHVILPVSHICFLSSNTDLLSGKLAQRSALENRVWGQAAWKKETCVCMTIKNREGTVIRS